MPQYIVKKSIQIKATPEQVWDALTNAEKTKQYFFHCKVFSDWKRGSKITFKGKLFFLFPIEMNGTILDIEPAKLLKYSLKNNKSGSESIVTDTLHFTNGITTLSITDDVGEGEGAEKRYNRSMKGWDKVLSGLKDLVEEH